MAFTDSDTKWLSNLKGLDDSLIPGAPRQVGLAQTGLSQYTNSLKNVRVRFGVASGRGGMTSYKGAPLSPNTPVIQLMTLNQAQGAANQLIRIFPSKIEKLSGSTWADITGTATLSGTSTTRPDYTVIQDKIVFTMEGLSRPFEYTGTGNVLPLASSTPPFAKAVVQYMQFCMLGNISNNGTFTDVFDGWRTIQYSDQFETNWGLCSGNLIDLNQTTGDLLRMKVLGPSLICYKDDGVVEVQWVAGAVRFTQRLLPVAGGEGSIGCAAPFSVQPAGESGHMMLGTNGLLYLVTLQGLKAVSQEALARTLPTTQKLLRFKFARSLVIPSQDLYVLFYDATGLTGQLLDSYVTYNYRSGEFTKGTLGKTISAAGLFKPDFQTDAVALVGSDGFVFEYDSVNSATDNGVSIDRFWTSGWQQLAGEDGWFFGVRLIFRKSNTARVAVSVATNFNSSFIREQWFSLKGNDPSDDFVELTYRFPSPVFTMWANVKVRMFHDSSAATSELLRIGFLSQPLHKVPVTPQQTAAPGISQGG